MSAPTPVVRAVVYERDGERCAVEGCDKEVRAKGYCVNHWRSNHLYGHPLASKPRPSVDERFWSMVNKTESCWLWTGAISDTGYGAFNAGTGRSDRRYISAHRYAYTTLVGEVAEGLHLDHLCRVRECCNPSHLEPVTPAENMRRGESPGAISHRTNRCGRGHDLLIYGLWANRSSGKRTRYCAECARIRRSK